RRPRHCFVMQPRGGQFHGGRSRGAMPGRRYLLTHGRGRSRATMPGWLAILSHILTGLPQRESLQASAAEFTTASSTLRFLVGLCQGAVCPVMDCMNRPPNERENGLSGGEVRATSTEEGR